MKLIKIALLICLAFFPGLMLMGQTEESPNLRMIGRYNNGKVELRWFPTSAAKWRLANQNGYILERMEMTDTDSGKGWVKLTKDAIKPMSMDQWNNSMDMTNKYVQATARAIHEKPEPPRQNAEIEKWLDYQNQETGLYTFVVLSTNIEPEAALGAAMRFEDQNITSGHPYAYRLTINETRNPTAQDTALVILEDTRTSYVPPSVYGLRLEEHEQTLKLFWEAENNDRLFGLYHIERSTDKQNFKRVTDLPIYLGAKDATEHIFIDSVENYQRYSYRVIGITPFGDEGKTSEVVEGMARDFSPAVGATEIKAKGNRQAVDVTWNLLVKSPDLSGFYIGRGPNANGPFAYINEKLLSPNARSFKDESPRANEPFYIVHAVDTAGNVSPAFAAMASVFDDEPPSAPVGLYGEIDTLGLVTIQWKENRESDLMGYHVFTANGKNDVYRPLTSRPVHSASIRDTVNMKNLDKEVYYKITALDYNNNPSGYSDVLILKRPDIIPPVAPSIYKYEVGEGTVNLIWHNSPSDDVSRHKLIRKKEAARESVELVSFENKELTSFGDKGLEAGSSYQYTLIAMDEAGNQTTSVPLLVTVYDKGVRPAVQQFTAEMDKETKTVSLSWVYDQPSNDYRFVIFKGKNEEPLKSFKSTGADRTTFQDLILSEGIYKYAIKVIYPDGGESGLSETVQLMVGR